MILENTLNSRFSDLSTLHRKLFQHTDVGFLPFRRENSPTDTLELRFSGEILFSGRSQPKTAEARARQFVKKHAQAIRQLYRASSQRGWLSACQGADYIEPGQTANNHEREQAAEQAYKAYFDNPQALIQIRKFLSHKQIRNSLLLSQLKYLEQYFTAACKTPKLKAMEAALAENTTKLMGIHNSFRGVVDGTTFSNSEIFQRLTTTDDPVEARKLWMAGSEHGRMQTGSDGQTLAEGLQNLVRQRNAVARQYKQENGQPYPDYFSWQLAQQEIDEPTLVQLLEQMDHASRKPYKTYLAQVKKFSQSRYGISAKAAALPWFGWGNMKRMLAIDLGPYLKGKNPLALMEKTANLMGESVQKIFDASVYVREGEHRSSIYFDPEKDHGKTQFWLCQKVDIPNDIRVLGSADPNHQHTADATVKILLHESVGHGLDSSLVSPRLSSLLRHHHSITTESHAMLMEDLMKETAWLERVVGIPKNKAAQIAKKMRLLNQVRTLNRLRSIIAMVDFERQMYQNPDQDLSKLWWDLQEKYLGVRRPPGNPIPEYACVPHYFSHPAYYQNYFLADLIRAQKLAYIQENFGGLLTPEAGQYLRSHRKQGGRFPWPEMVERMTGKPLRTDALKQEFADMVIPDNSGN